MKAALLLLLSCGCGSLATSPAWVGGGMVVTGPMRVSLDDEEEPQTLAKRKSGEPEEIRARHILVMHVESQARPEQVTRTREEARQRAQEVLLKIRGGADFTEMVREYTDEPGGAERGGDLGAFRKEVMVEAFAEAAFALKVGEVSEVVETEYGFHVIKRTQ